MIFRMEKICTQLSGPIDGKNNTSNCTSLAEMSGQKQVENQTSKCIIFLQMKTNPFNLYFHGIVDFWATMNKTLSRF